MHRFHASTADENVDLETPLGRSYHSTISAISTNNNSASSSKAVLAALRALQEKIRRLEAERSQAFDEATQLRHAIKNQEIEAEHSKQRENLSTQKSVQEAKLVYEKVQSEKTDLEIRLSKLEDKNRSDNRVLEELKVKIRSLEDEKFSGQSRIKELESERSQLHFDIEQAMQKEKDLADTMVWESKRHEEDIDELSQRLRVFQTDLSTAAHEKSLVDKKLVELDQLVGQLLSVNETLVAQLSGKPINKLLKKKKAVASRPLVPRVASVSTVSTEANRAAGTSQYRYLQSQIAGAAGALPKESIDGLHKMHMMYVDLARGITHGKDKKSSPFSNKCGDNNKGAKGPSHTTRIKKKKEKKSDSSANNLSAAASISRASAWSGGGDNSFNSAAVGSGTDTTGAGIAAAAGNTSSVSARGGDVSQFSHRIPSVHIEQYEERPSSPSFAVDSNGFNGRRGPPPPASTSLSSPSLFASVPRPSSSSYYNQQQQSSSSSGSGGAGGGSRTKGRGGGGVVRGGAAGGELQQVISSLEDEFASLNGQYRHLLTSMRSDSPAVESKQAEELVSVIQKLHKKGEQLRALRSPSR